MRENGIYIRLDLRDRRGREVRVSQTKELRIRVWTQNPEHFLTFRRRDITAHDGEEGLWIERARMAALESGVIEYAYNFKEGGARGAEAGRMVTTDLYWRNLSGRGGPNLYGEIEHLSDLIEEERHERQKSVASAIQTSKKYTDGRVDGQPSITAKEIEALFKGAAPTETEKN